jgi:hypothetical protein
MKRIKTLTAILVLVLFSYLPVISTNAPNNSVSVVQRTGTMYYKLTVDYMFQPSDRAKIDEVFLKNSAPFTIEDIDYTAKTILIRMTSKAPFDDVKQIFDKVGMRIAKEELIIKS